MFDYDFDGESVFIIVIRSCVWFIDIFFVGFYLLELFKIYFIVIVNVVLLSLLSLLLLLYWKWVR